MLKKCFLPLFLVITFFASAQVIGPEQDCLGAIVVCQPVFVQTNSYQGVGTLQEISSSCLENGENNSVWYTFEVADTGAVEFLITPQQTDDYDFSLYDITGLSCEDIFYGSANEVRCNYSYTAGATGLKAGYTTTSEGSNGFAFLMPLGVLPGQKFALVVDNFSSTTGGYTLDFSGSTAQLADPNGVTLQNASNVKCAADSFIQIKVSGSIRCSSVAADGSDFQVPGITILGAQAFACKNGMSRDILIRYTGQLINGQSYAIGLQQGTDGNSLEAFCGAAIQSTYSFVVNDSLAEATVADFSYFSVNRTAYFTEESSNGVEFIWDFGDGTVTTYPRMHHEYPSGGVYTVCLIAKGVCSADTICKQVHIAENEISGKVYVDHNSDCQFAGGDVPIKNQIVRIDPGSRYTMTDHIGNYSILTSPGNFTVKHLLPAFNPWRLDEKCPANSAGHSISFTAPYQDTAHIDFADTAIICPFLTVDVSADRRRMCMTSGTAISYCNDGFAAASNVSITVIYPQHIVLVGANRPYQPGGSPGHYIFNIGTLQAQECGSIILQDSVTCNNALLGLTQCVEAFITPRNTCIPPHPNWSGADITLDGECDNGTAVLMILNAGTGDMTDSSTFRIYLDSSLVLTQKFRVDAYDTLRIEFPVNGQTVRIEADQVPFHPENTQVSQSFEGCSGTPNPISLGFIIQFPPNDNGPTHDKDCGLLSNSFDPNDKQAMPTGVSESHYILAETKIDYTIRFQNTGNDTAYDVMILDTISLHLDLSTLHINGASHPFEVTMTGEGQPVLVFSFEDIYLPDSTTDFDGSQGFVSFTIAPYDATPLFTRIENFADIYFDLNPPVRTNTVFHTISNTKFVSSDELDSVTIIFSPNSVGISQIQEGKMDIYPNPTTGKMTIQLDYAGTKGVQAEVLDALGRLVYREPVGIRDGQAELDFRHLPKSIYVLKLFNSDFTASRKFTLLR